MTPVSVRASPKIAFSALLFQMITKQGVIRQGLTVLSSASLGCAFLMVSHSHFNQVKSSPHKVNQMLFTAENLEIIFYM